MPLQTGQLATQLGVTRQTIRTWASRFSFALTPRASAAGQNREFAEEDVLVLTAVARWRSEFHSSLSEIDGMLRAGAHRELPPEEPQPVSEEPTPSLPPETAVTIHGQYQDLIEQWRTIAEDRGQEVEALREENRRLQTDLLREVRKSWLAKLFGR